LSLKLIAPLAAVLALSACAPKPPVLQASDPRNDGIAKVCTPTNPDTSKPGPYTAAIAMSNDGWCGVSAVDRSGKPFSLALVRVRPSHGRVFNQEVANVRRIEYTPDAGYTGADSFTVALRSSQAGGEDVPLAVSVNVAQGDAPAVAAPATPATRPAAPSSKPSTTRRSSTRRSGSSSSR
jgi:hypothetical protein